MKIKDIRAALTALVLSLVEDAKVIRTDIPKPIMRPAFKIDVLPMGGGVSCSGAHEREVDVDIWYYPADEYRPRDECDEVAARLLDALEDGFAAGGVWLSLDDDLTIHMSQGVLVCQFAISWSESAAETGETMETLTYNGEELTT